MDPNTKLVRPEERKGLVQLKAEAQDGMNLIHFLWKQRPSGTVELDLILFPSDAVFRKVNEANARVYVLEFKTSDKKHFFWMQEPSDEKDDEYCKDLNKFMNNPPQPGETSGGEEALGDSLGNLDQNQLLQFLASSQGGGNLNGLRELLQRGVGGGGSGIGSNAGTPYRPPTRQPTATGSRTPSSNSATSSTTPSTGSQTSSSNTSVLKNILGNLAKDRPPEVSLVDVINIEEIIKSGLLDHEEIVKKLVEFLPEGNITAENLKDNLHSPQLKSAIRLFNQALQGGELSAISLSFGLDISAMGPNSTIEDFLLAIQNQVKKENEEKK